jgi:IS5 family transposase
MVLADTAGPTRQQLERRRTFRRTVKWRTGCERRISTLKRAYGWDRTRVDSLQGAKTWTGQGVYTHNHQDRRTDRVTPSPAKNPQLITTDNPPPRRAVAGPGK